MARVTVEDCIDKMPNRFELVLVTANRARDLRSGSAITVERENDKDAVVALREIAEKTISPNDMREMLIHSMQEQVEIDEPEAVAAPLLPQGLRPILGRDDPTIDAGVDTLTEEQLLHAMQKLSPEDPTKDGTDQQFMSAEIDRLISAVGFRTLIEPVRSSFHVARRTFVDFWGRPYDEDGDRRQVEASYLNT